jgi:type VI secretion system protein ImpM
MQCGIFGKLPAKRDFVSYNIPRPFLNAWESWLQAAVAESRHAMGDKWTGIFLTQPILHFWCGPGVFGQAVAGAIMPSVDGVGRYFPLSICAVETGDGWPAPPDSGVLDNWLAACDTALLGQLEDGAEFEASRVLDQVGLPPVIVPTPSHQGGDPVHIWSDSSGTLQPAFAALYASDCVSLNSRRGIWWTSGSDSQPAQLITTQGPPQPSLWITFMTGLIAT